MRKCIIVLALVTLLVCQLANATGIYVLNNGPSGVATPSITTYPLNANANATPSTTIQGASTGFSTSTVGGICVDPTHSFIWVTDQTNNKLSRFNVTDNGNVAPGVTISGASTTLNRPLSCYFNSSGDIWVSNLANNNVLRWSAAHLIAGGNIAPDTTFTASDMSEPETNWVDSSGNIYVGVFGSPACVSSNCFAYLFPSSASGTTVPTAKWTFWKSGSHVVGIGVGGSKLYLGLPGSGLTCPATGTPFGGIYRYDNTNTSSGSAPDSAICGANTTLSSNIGQFGIDSNGGIAVPDFAATPSVTIFYPTRSGNVAPDQRIIGASTGLASPSAVAIIGNFPVPPSILWPFP